MRNNWKKLYEESFGNIHEKLKSYENISSFVFSKESFIILFILFEALVLLKLITFFSLLPFLILLLPLSLLKLKNDTILSLIKKQFENIYQKLDEVVEQNKQLELNLNKYNYDLNQLKEKIDGCMCTIDILKDEVNKLKKEIKIKHQDEHQNGYKKNYYFNANENIHYKSVDLIQTNIVLDHINKNNFNTPQKSEMILTRLKNIDQAVFINPIIQCLFYTEPLWNYLKYLNIKNHNLKLAISFQELIKQLSDKNTKIFDSKNFIKTITEIIYEKKYVGVNNAYNSIYDYLEFILEQLHQELKEKMTQSDLNRIKFSCQQELHAFNNIINEKSIITELFQLVNEIKIQPLDSNTRQTNYKFEKNLYLPVNFGNNVINNMTIINCLVNKRLKSMQTNYQNIPSLNKEKILVCPKILIIMLKYANENYCINLNVEEKLDITTFSKFENENNVENQIYNLYGVISKINNNFENKYVATYKNHLNGNWYRFDEENILNLKDINNVAYSGIPLILFYSKVQGYY